MDYLLRFKDIVSNHVHRQGKLSSGFQYWIPIRPRYYKEPALDLFKRPDIARLLELSCTIRRGFSSTNISRQAKILLASNPVSAHRGWGASRLGSRTAALHGFGPWVSQPVFDSGQEFVRTDRFRDIFIGPRFHPCVAGKLAGQARQHDDWSGGSILASAQGLTDGKTVQLRKHQIQ